MVGLDYRDQWRVPNSVAGGRIFTGHTMARAATAECAAVQGGAARNRLPGRFARSASCVEVRAHRVGGEERFPQPRCEFVHPCRRMRGHALQDIDQVVVGVDAVQATGDDQALQDADMLGAEFGPAKQPCLPAHGNDAERAFQVVGIDGDVRVGKEYFQSESSLSRIGQCSRERAFRQQALILEALCHPVEEAIHQGLGVHQPVVFLLLALQFVLGDMGLDGVDRTDLVQRLGRSFRFDVLGLDEFTPGVRPALAMGNAGDLGIALIGGIAVGEQRAIFHHGHAQYLVHMFGAAGFAKGKADLVAFAIDRPEIALFHLALAVPSGLDRGLVHGLDAGIADRGELGFVDGFQQRGPLLRQLREPRAADGEAGIHQALMLAIEGKVIGELIEEQASNEADIGAAAFDHADRSCGRADGLGIEALGDGADVLDDHVAAGTLRQAISFLGADDLELLGGQTFEFRIGQFDDFHGHAGFVKEGDGFRARIGGLSFTGVGGDGAGWRFGRRTGLGHIEHFAQAHLLSGFIDKAFFAFLAEDLAFKPFDLMFERSVLLLQ